MHLINSLVPQQNKMFDEFLRNVRCPTFMSVIIITNKSIVLYLNVSSISTFYTDPFIFYVISYFRYYFDLSICGK